MLEIIIFGLSMVGARAEPFSVIKGVSSCTAGYHQSRGDEAECLAACEYFVSTNLITTANCAADVGYWPTTNGAVWTQTAWCIMLYPKANANPSHVNMDAANTASPAQSAMWVFGQICVKDSASVGGDPVTQFRGVEHKFILPIGQLTTLLRSKSLALHASAFQGEFTDLQWIEQIVVDSAAGERVLQVSIRRDIASFEKLEDASDLLETIEVRAPWMSEGPLTFPKNQEVRWGSFAVSPTFDHPHNISLSLLRIQNPSSMDKAAPRREGVLITCDELKLFVVSTSAFEYYWTDADSERALQYSHLDFELLDLKHPYSFSGLLPEVWGLVPMLNQDTNRRAREPIPSEQNPDAQAMQRLILSSML